MAIECCVAGHAHRWRRPGVGFSGRPRRIFLALASPIELFASLLLQVHMLQHLLLMLVAPPLLWLGRPLLPLVRGLPEPIRTYWIAPLFRSRSVRRFFAGCTHPATALPLYVAATWIWHLPLVYDMALLFRLALSSTRLFPRGGVSVLVSRRAAISEPATLVTVATVAVFAAGRRAEHTLAALLTYPPIASLSVLQRDPALAGLSALDDQSAAGVLMWVPGSVAFLVPLFGIGVQLLCMARSQESGVRGQESGRSGVADLAAAGGG